MGANGNGFHPGWGVMDGGVRHWVRPDFRRACDPQNLTSYSGDTIDDTEVVLAELCPHCVVVTIQAKAVVG